MILYSCSVYFDLTFLSFFIRMNWNIINFHKNLPYEEVEGIDNQKGRMEGRNHGGDVVSDRQTLMANKIWMKPKTYQRSTQNSTLCTNVKIPKLITWVITVSYRSLGTTPKNTNDISHLIYLLSTTHIFQIK